MSLTLDDAPAGEGAAGRDAAKARSFALLGPPNAGKSTLFNGLTGGLAKVGNYPGVTVELRHGAFALNDGRRAPLVDLPGVSALKPRSADAAVTVEVIEGRSGAVAQPDVLIVVVDAGQLRRHLRFIAEALGTGRPAIIALNMADLATRDGVRLDPAALEEALGVPVVLVTATRAKGRQALLARLGEARPGHPPPPSESGALAEKVILEEPGLNKTTRGIDRLVLHPVAGVALLMTILFFVFQAVFAWATPFMDGIEAGIGGLGQGAAAILPDGWLESLVVDGAIAGVGAVIVFLPQILILFFFILLLEQTGYMARAAFLSDELMRRAGLHGRALIPLLSSFACAIPGMMATRVMESERDRITTIMVAPLMTCSARLPVYTVMIAAFIPKENVGPFGLQGMVMFGLYLAGVISAVGVASILRRTVTKGGTQTLMMELPTYKLPQPRDLVLGLWSRVMIFLKRAGTVIFAASVIIWVLVSYPGETLRESFAGRIGSVLEPIFAPIGFTLEMVIALVPAIAAREVAVGALGTVYAVQNPEANAGQLEDALAASWSLPAALAFIAWFVFAPQCISTIAVARRELNSWKWTGLMVAYLFGLAYLASGITYWTARALL